MPYSASDYVVGKRNGKIYANYAGWCLFPEQIGVQHFMTVSTSNIRTLVS